MSSRIITSSFADCVFTYTKSTSNKTDRLVLLLGWYASNAKQLAKYSKFYNSRGIDTLALTLPHSAVFSSQARARANQAAIAKSIETVITSTIPTPNKLVAHVLSNGGYFGLLSIEPATTPTLFKLLEGGGLVIDSAPAYLHAIAGARAISYSMTQKTFARSLIAALVTPLFVLNGMYTRLTTGIDVQASYWERSINYPHNGPELYLFSTADLLVDAEKLEGLISARKATNSKITSFDFIDSPHVLHYRVYSSKYEELLENFLKNLNWL